MRFAGDESRAPRVAPSPPGAGAQDPTLRGVHAQTPAVGGPRGKGQSEWASLVIQRTGRARG